MGLQKNVALEKQEAHIRKHRYEGWECEICGFIPPPEEDAILSLGIHMVDHHWHIHEDK